MNLRRSGDKFFDLDRKYKKKRGFREMRDLMED
jgi:hypothetical protein